MSSFVELVDDVLFNVFKFLNPLDIIAARKTCKRLQAITLDRSIWTTTYKASTNDFLPVVFLSSQTIPELERLLLRAHRLDTLWVHSLPLNQLRQQSWSINCSIKHALGSILQMEFYQGRYLVVLGSKAIVVYDLNDKHEVFRHDVADDQYFSRFRAHGHRADIVEDPSSDFIFLFSAIANQLPTDPRTFILCITCSGMITIVIRPELQFTNLWKAIAITIRNEFALVRHAQSIELLHLSSHKVYNISSRYKEVYDDIPDMDTFFIAGGYVLLGFHEDTAVPTSSETQLSYFELYQLPDHTVLPTGSCLQPTHRSRFECPDQWSRLEILLYSDFSLKPNGSIWLIRQYNVFERNKIRITPTLDGGMTFEPSVTKTEPTGTRGISWKCDHRRETKWLLCDVYLDSKGEPCIRTTKVDLGCKMIGFSAYPVLDASWGLLAIPTENSGEILVTDFVL
ncbi:hypothetical protein BDP27DRAFT_1337093 [Rhodocollybia butyracea]|uniref:F-box domain-containing protein n=1 Tax=Rhodocollybia butyracea TaxID=206335 RepID=A0A9P5PAU3_9AGAR|nr:hypothetical protein BDP27DRAFT_1337093 [Rhodocollybia butyracea]